MAANWTLAITINIVGNFISAVGWMLQKRQHVRSRSEMQNTSHQRQSASLSTNNGNIAIPDQENVENEMQSHDPDQSDPYQTNLKYVKTCGWWIGFLMYGGGSAIGSISFAYGPNSLLIPLETFVLVFTTILGWKFLNEKLYLKDYLGIICIFIGVIGSVMVAPKEEQQDEYNIYALANLYKQVNFWIFIICYTSIQITGYIMFKMDRIKQYLDTKNENYFLIIFVNLSSYFGSWNVVLLKSGLEIVSSSFNGAAKTNFSHFLTYLIFLGFNGTILSMEFWRQKALSLFVSTYVLAVYRVFVNIGGILFGAFYWNDFSSDDIQLWHIILYIIGTIITFIGVGFIAMKPNSVKSLLMQWFKNTKPNTNVVDIEIA